MKVDKMLRRSVLRSPEWQIGRHANYLYYITTTIDHRPPFFTSTNSRDTRPQISKKYCLTAARSVKGFLGHM